MKKTILAFSIIFSGLMVNAQKTKQKTVAPVAAKSTAITAQQVIDKYIKALGGEDKLKAVKTLKMNNVMTVMGMEVKGSTKKMLPNKFKTVQNAMGQDVVQVFDGEKGYMSQGGQKMDLPEPQIKALKETTQLFEALTMQASKYVKAEKETLDGKDYYVLTSDKSKLYIDTATDLLYKAISEKGTMVIKDYETVEGIKFPKTTDMEAQGQKISVTNSNIEINKNVSEQDFSL